MTQVLIHTLSENIKNHFVLALETGTKVSFW